MKFFETCSCMVTVVPDVSPFIENTIVLAVAADLLILK
jgi:hypothetical protein